MLMIAAQGHKPLIWGIALVVVGVLHLAFRGFYANRAAAMHEARRQTAPGPTRALYRPRGRGFYLVLNSTISAVMVIAGIILIAANA
jgi:hypothetical protein